jgi:hypothetical protein
VQPERTPHVHEAVLRMAPDTDPRAAGAVVTVELCGSVDHDGPCRWPKDHHIDVPPSGAAVFRRLFVPPEADVAEVHAHAYAGPGSGTGWSVVSERRRPLTEDEERGAAKLARTTLWPQ